MKDVNILTLFGISIEELERYEMIDESINSVTFLVRKRKEFQTCNNCGSVNLKVKDYKPKKYKFLSQTGIEINVIFEHRRLVCPDCGKTVMEKNPFIWNGNYKVSPKKF